MIYDLGLGILGALILKSELINLEHMITKTDNRFRNSALALVVVSLSFSACARYETNEPPNLPATVSDLVGLSESSPGTLNQLDIARVNLLCADGLPGAEHLHITASLVAIDQMATRVGSETARHTHRFQKNPAEFENSEGFFRMMMLMVVLAEDFRVQYAPNKMANITSASAGDGFFADAQDVFLHGLTGTNRQGTCSSLPVLYVAVGRRLGYPLKLVATKGHLFVRWEDAQERFNFEAAGNGANRFADDYYRNGVSPEY